MNKLAEADTLTELGAWRRLPKPFDGYLVVRQWIPKAAANRVGAPPPRPGILLDQVSKVVIGDTGRRGLTAADGAKDLGQAYGHLLVDNETIIECTPALTSRVGLVEQAFFVRWRPELKPKFNAQESAITINLCFGGQIDAKATYTRCAALAAFICILFKLDPLVDIARAGDLDIARKDPDQALQAADATFAQLLNVISDAKKKIVAEMHQQTTQPNQEVAHA